MISIINNIYVTIKGFFAIGIGVSSIPIFLNGVEYPFNIIIGIFNIIVTLLIFTDLGITNKVIKQLSVQIDRLGD